MHDTERVRADFNAIALALEQERHPDLLSPCESQLLDLLPHRPGIVLDVGCGDGRLTRHLARRARTVVALDLSPEMIRLARDRSSGCTNIEYRVADVLTTPLPPAAFDVVVSVATLHHLPLAETLGVLKTALSPGGTLLVQDVVDRSSLRYLPRNAVAYALQLVRGAAGARYCSSRQVRRLFRHHGIGEHYLTPRDVEQVYSSLLPGARLMHHTEWRYSVAWTAPAP